MTFESAPSRSLLPFPPTMRLTAINAEDHTSLGAKFLEVSVPALPSRDSKMSPKARGSSKCLEYPMVVAVSSHEPRNGPMAPAGGLATSPPTLCLQ